MTRERAGEVERRTDGERGLSLVCGFEGVAKLKNILTNIKRNDILIKQAIKGDW